MVRLSVMPNQAIVSGWKGKIDFYYYMGIPVARRWPRPPSQRRSPAVESTWPVFTSAVHAWPLLSVDVQDAYRKMASGSALTGRDLFIRSYIKGLYRYTKGDDMLPSCSVYLSAPFLNIPNTTYVKVPFDTESFDTTGDFDVVNNRFIVPRDGNYLVLTNLLFYNLVADRYYNAQIYVNGVRVKSSHHHASIANYLSAINLSILSLVRYDFIEIYAHQASGVGTVGIFSANNPIHTFFEVSLLQ